MTLAGLGAKRCDLRVMRRLCPTTSIWTVDLAHLLRRFGVDVTFCTITLGANPDFASEARAGATPLRRRARALSTRTPSTRAQSFYVDTMEEDGRRVERLFRDAAALGIAIQARAPRCWHGTRALSDASRGARAHVSAAAVHQPGRDAALHPVGAVPHHRAG